jgi:uncharacterized Zn-finger protein
MILIKIKRFFQKLPQNQNLLIVQIARNFFFQNKIWNYIEFSNTKYYFSNVQKRIAPNLFLKEEYLKEHNDMVHKKGKIEKPYKCDKTQKCINKDVAFRTQGELNQHLKRYDGRFATISWRLCRHDPKTHVCDICGKAFAMKGDLENHLRIHTGEKIFSCRIEGCNETFISSSKRLYHEKKSRH